jgi:hypothetical protein
MESDPVRSKIRIFGAGMLYVICVSEVHLEELLYLGAMDV